MGGLRGRRIRISRGRGRGLHLSDDLLIVEPVDARGRAVPSGVRSAKVYLTNLYNLVLPLIRYGLTDEVTLLEEPCSCGSAHRLVEDVQGRLNDTFVYPQAGRFTHTPPALASAGSVTSSSTRFARPRAAPQSPSGVAAR